MSCDLISIIEKIKDKLICRYNSESKINSSKDEFMQSEIENNCKLSSISIQDCVIILEVKKKGLHCSGVG